MRSRIVTLLVVAVSSAACGSAGPSAPPGLAYGLPQVTSVRYVTSDTTSMDIDAAGQAMQAQVLSRAVLGTTFSRAAEGVQVTVEVEDMDARVANPMGSVTADENGVDGALVFTLDRRGSATVVSQPTLTETAGQFFQPLSLAHGLFPRLPGRAAAVGEEWTDTIRTEGAQGAGTVNAVTIMTYTVAGDTLVEGRSLLRIDLEGTNETSAQGVTTGMDFSQKLTGSMTGWVLWDMQRGLMVESYTSSRGSGSMEVAAAPFPLGLSLRSISRVKLEALR